MKQKKNKYDHYKWHLETRHTSGQSKPFETCTFFAAVQRDP